MLTLILKNEKNECLTLNPEPKPNHNQPVTLALKPHLELQNVGPHEYSKLCIVNYTHTL